MGAPQVQVVPKLRFQADNKTGSKDDKKHRHKKQASSIQIPIQVASPYLNQPSPAIQPFQQHQFLQQQLQQQPQQQQQQQQQQLLSHPHPISFYPNGNNTAMPTPFSTAPPSYNSQPQYQTALYPHMLQQQQHQHQHPTFFNNGISPYFQSAPGIASQLAQLNQKIIDITNQQTKKKNSKPPQQLPPGYKFNSDAFTTAFDNARLLNCLQIVTHQLNEKAEINEYLLLRPFAKDYVSETGTRISVEYDENKEEYVTVAADKINPTEKEDYVGVRTVGVITNDDIFFTILEFIPLPLNGGRETRPKKGERPVPLETFRGWSSLVIMEARKRKVLSMLD